MARTPRLWLNQMACGTTGIWGAGMQGELRDSHRQVSAVWPTTALPRTVGNENSTRSIGELVRAAQHGSNAAFDELQVLYRQRLFRQIVAITGNREDAEDALQDALLRAFVKLQSFEGRSHFYTWLSRIAINSALMKIRKRRQRAEIALECSIGAEGEPLPLEVSDTALNPEQICDLRQRVQKTFSAIKRLEPSLRSVIQIGVAEGLSMEEIAQALYITEPAAKARLHRARRRLRSSKFVRELGAHQVSALQVSTRSIVGPDSALA